MENVKRKIWILSFSLGLVVIVTGDQKTCNQKLRCNECITAHPDCAWCNTEDFTGSRCSTVDDLNNKGCGDMSHPSNQVEFLQDDSLRNGSTSHDSLQLAPQHIRLKMKPGEKYHLHMKYLVAANIPIDMYFIMDFTTTMDRRIQQLADLTQELIDGLKQTFTTNIQIGFGSFLDKVVQPFTLTTAKRLENPCGYPPCGSPYAFIHRWKLTDDVDGFISMIRNSNTSANWDPMEGGLDAVLQASVCPEVIGWRNQSRRVLIHISDGGFHFAGDGKLGGIDRPSDGQCHLEPLNDNSGQYSYTQASNQDYPSFGHIKHVLKENGINAFFLSVSSNIKIYKGLTDFIGSQADTAEMDNTGAYKLIRSISEFYTALSSKLNIAAVDIPEDVSVIAETNCSTSRVESTFDLKKKPIECKGLQIGTLVHINVTFLVNECPVNKDEKKILKILPSGLQESLTVEIEYICDCDCPTSEALDEQCSYGNGTYECGVCRCHEGRSGELCQCNFGDESDVTVNEQKCKMDEKSSTLCENRGTCNCGQCFCHKNYDGKYCECDSSKCVYPGTSQKCTRIFQPFTCRVQKYNYWIMAYVIY
ncbi:integrin [Mactra antiquata]